MVLAILVVAGVAVDVLGSDALVVHRHDVPVVSTDVSLLVLVRVLESLQVIQLVGILILPFIAVASVVGGSVNSWEFLR